MQVMYKTTTVYPSHKWNDSYQSLREKLFVSKGLHWHPCFGVHLRYPVTKRLIPAKSNTASTLWKEELHLVLIKSTRNSDCLLPLVCQIEAKWYLSVTFLWSNNNNIRSAKQQNKQEQCAPHCAGNESKASREAGLGQSWIIMGAETVFLSHSLRYFHKSITLF